MFEALLIGSSYNRSSINANNEVKPGLDGQIQVSVAQDLEAEGPLLLLPLLLNVTVQARDEAV